MPRKKGNTTLQFRFNGKRYSVTAPTRDEAIARKAIKLKELEDGERRISKSATVNEWIETWLVTYKQNKVNAAWFRDIKGICRNYIIPPIGNLKISSVKPVQLQKPHSEIKKNPSQLLKLQGVSSGGLRGARTHDNLVVTHIAFDYIAESQPLI